MSKLRVVGGGIDRTESDVTVRAPTVDMRKQALMSGSTPQGLLIGKERNADEAQRCSKCRKLNADIVVDVLFVKDDGFPIRLCRTCIDRQPSGDPIRITIQLAD